MKETSKEIPNYEKRVAETALKYASMSILGAWIGFLMWAPRPDLIPSQILEEVQKSLLK